MLVLQHRGGPLDGEFFLINVENIGHIEPDPPGCKIHMTGYNPSDTPIDVVEDMDTMRNRFAIRRPTNPR